MGALCLMIGQLNAQICNGSLGENIFLAGDFGAGTENFLQSDPNVAPGYTYTVNPPPQDGLYSISNNTGLWNSLFPTWLEIGDNSNDPNGYMMVVNASFDPGLFYEQTVDGLCENTLYVFSVDIINMIRVGVTDHIRPNVSFLIDNQVSFTSGEIPQDAAWHHYGFTFTTAPGQTTVQLSLQNNAPGGIGNDLALDNITFRPCGPEAFILPESVANICEDGDPITLDATVQGNQYSTPVFQWQISSDEGMTWNHIMGANSNNYRHDDLRSGYYHYRFLLANDPSHLDNARCHVISNAKIVFVQPKSYLVTDTICEGLTYQHANKTYDLTGVYIDSLVSAIGCDSIVTLDLTVISDPNISVEYSVVDLNCHDDNTGSIVIDHVSSAVDPFTLTVDAQILGDALQIDNLPGGSYTLGLVDRYGCQFRDTVLISQPNPFLIDIGNDTTILFGSSIGLGVASNFPINDYIWLSDQVLECVNCPMLEFTPFDDQLVKVEVVSQEGCTAIDSIFISIDENRSVYLPNAFSPNGDRRNDYFNVHAPSSILIGIDQMEIYDRWGGVLWSQADILPNVADAGWPGTSGDGSPVVPGIYLYTVDVRFIDGKVVRMGGDVLLLR